MSKNRRSWIVWLVGLLLVLALWHQVFVMTGVLWWNAPQPTHRLPAFESVRFRPLDTRNIDVRAFLQTHPEWNPR